MGRTVSRFASDMSRYIMGEVVSISGGPAMVP